MNHSACQQTLPLDLPTPGTMLAGVRERLGHRALVRASDVSAACNVAISTVYAWIEEGLIEAVNIGSREKPYYQIYAPSVSAFYARRMAATGEGQQ